MRSEAVPDLPEITSDNFVSSPSASPQLPLLRLHFCSGYGLCVLLFQEERLCSDSVLADFLNEFLLLPSFLEPIRYNKDRGVFEVGIDTGKSLSAQITALLSELKEKSADPTWFPAKPLVDNSYIVSCLDQVQAMQWIRRKRLPFFLQSDCYIEYRLASCLCQLIRPKEKLSREESSYSTSASSLHHEFATSLNTGHSDTSGDCSSPHTEHPAISSRRNKEATKGKTKTIQIQTNFPSYSEDVDVEVGHLIQLCKEQSPSPPPGLNGHILDTTPSTVQSNIAAMHKDLEEDKEMGHELDQDTDWDLEQDTCPELDQATTNMGAYLSPVQTEYRSVLRYLAWMKNQYLLSSSSTALSVEFLSRLDLISPSCWTEDRLCLIQPHLTEVLLLYWGHRFMSHLHTERRSTTFLWPCWDCQMSLPGLDSCPRHPSPLILNSVSYLPHTPSAAGSQCSESERMVQALCVESRAGFFFTHFCKNSGNQLWANAAQLYRELHEYHQLFYQPTLDPYRIQHKAQLLYATYVCSAAGSSVGVEEQCRQDIFTHLIPPYEELFDEAEEHILSLLLEPWTTLTHQDMRTFHKVAVWEEERFVEPDLYKTLQSLYTQAEHRQQQCAQERRPPPPPGMGAKQPDPWAQVPLQFRRHRLGTLLRNRLELQHFLAFLEENFASMDLLCWLDIEQLKRTPNDAAVWEEKCRNIRTQYLNRKYLFGPSSPANKQQQTELLRLAGGWAHLQYKPLSMSMLSEVQSLVKSRIERKWLPLFLSSEDFITRQKLQAELGDVVEDQLFLRYRKKRQVWKQVNGGLMSSSQEVLALRRALLNPITRLHFRLFLSVRGELLENDVLFWLEVQRYKELCHSHCDEAVVQQKVSTIISCFIDSCIPPSVQIHLPPEQALLILESRSTLGPYIFREAQ
ncbi:hypothetical protein NFI96_015399, partial [Prochilodus magdalenae]